MCTDVHYIYSEQNGTIMKNDLTQRQKNILDFIQEYISFNGYPPTYREIGKQFGITSTFGVKRHIDALIKKGFLNSESNTSRTLSLTDLNSVNHKGKLIPESLPIPIVGRVAAGYPVLAEENIEGTLSIDASLIKRRKNCFGLKVRGDSMIEAGIFEGDIVIVNQQKDAMNGDIVIALLGDESTLKRFEINKNEVHLIPANKKYSKIILKNREDFTIIGKVLGVFRWYN